MPLNKPEAQKPEAQKPEASREEQIGFHKGSLQTLVGERNELVRLIQITEGFMQAHIQALEKLGVRIQQPQPAKKEANNSNLEGALGRTP